MFVDIVGAAEVSNHKSPFDYATFVRSFQRLFSSVCDQYTEKWYSESERQTIEIKARGDEGLLLIYHSSYDDDVSLDVDIAVNIALELKRRWICGEENRSRIEKSGLLPIDLAIGIHSGPTVVLDKNAEGYTINLAKRVESSSREGRFTHIFLSEAAHGQLADLPDEITYLFDESQLVSPKGISRDIRIYAVKHHFLASDWKEGSARKKRGRTLLNPETVDLGVIGKALRLNPTNLWLKEEFIRSSMLRAYWGLAKKDQEDYDKLKRAFAQAVLAADSLRQSDQKDAGVLFIQGLVRGECGEFDTERDFYQKALDWSEKLGLAHWYKGQSYSQEVYESLGYEVLGVSFETLGQADRKLASKALESLKEASSLHPLQAWMHYDYGCELIQWRRTHAEVQQGIGFVTRAVDWLPDIGAEIPEEPYLAGVLEDARIQKLLAKHASA